MQDNLFNKNKSLIISFVFVGFSFTFAQQWHSVEPRVVDQTLFSISFCDSMYGAAVGEKGVILHTADGGSSWELQQSGVTDTLLDISFGDSLNGMAVGNKSIILKTVDGGKTWQKLKTKLDSIGETFSLKYVNCFGKDTCWITFSYALFFTFDGGKTWGGTGFDYKTVIDVCFKNSHTFWAVCSDGVSFKTSNGGLSFDTLQKPVFPKDTVKPRTWSIGNILFVNDSIGWISNESGYLVLTNDGGISWKQLPLVDTTTYNIESPYFLINGFHFFTHSNGVVLAWYPKRILYKTYDGGLTWALDPNFARTSEFLQKLYYDKQDNGWTVGEFGAIYTNKKTKPALARNHRNVLYGIICDARFHGNKLIIKSTGDIGYVSLFDLTGKAVIARMPMEGSAGQGMTASVDLTGLAIGNYLCKFSSKNGTIFTRIIQKTR
jgi:photosystem II stability/assembly factor-like uncharacterized protein